MEQNDEKEPTKGFDKWKKWERELNAAEEHEKSWVGRARKIVKRYRDERDENQKDVSRFNILYSNTEVLKGALYQKTPTPEVRRRYGDKDPAGKAGSEVLDRCLSYSVDSYDFDGTMQSVVEDSLLPGRGIARVKYVPQMTEVDGVEQVVYEEARCEYHDWEHFRYSPAKRWDKVRWVAFGDLLTRDDLVRQFPGKGEQVKLDWAPDGKALDDCNDVVKRALVWQIWNKTDRKLYVWTSGLKELLAEVDDPLNLEGFFPCPKPLYAGCTTGSLIPVPDYTQYEDQALELDEITGRITALTDALRLRGVYDASKPELERLSKAGDNEFIPVENYAALVEKGGIENAFMTLPIEGIAKVLLGLYEQREQVKQIIYEVMGISDILRGSSEADETARAQEIKAQYGGLRIRRRQQAVQNFARDLLRLKAEIISDHFDPKTIAQMSGVQLPWAADKAQAQQAVMQAQLTGQPPPPQVAEILALPSWEDVIGVIRNDKMRGYRIDIETDSTIQPDQQVEQQSRIEALTAFSTMLERMVPAVQMGLMPPELAHKSIGWVLRSFKNPGEMEEVLEKMEGQPPQPQGPSPEQIKELEKREQEVQAATQKLQQDSMGLQEEGLKLKGERAVFDAEKSALQTTLKSEQEKLAAMEEAALTKIQAAQDALKTVVQAQQQADKERAKGAEAGAKAKSEGEAGTAMAAALAGLTAVIQEMGRPRKTTLQRGPDGRAVGAVSESVQ